jgi:hypothetical protein
MMLVDVSSRRSIRRLALLLFAAGVATTVIVQTAPGQAPPPAPPAVEIDMTPMNADLSATTTRERAQARRLWHRSERIAARRFRTPADARRQGYRGNVDRVRRPVPLFFHFRNPRAVEDGRELDPRRPEAIVYWYDPPKPLILVAFMYRVREGHEPRFGGSIFPWHSHCDGWSVVMHAWFTNDLSSAFARLAPRPELAEAFDRDFGDPTPDSAAGCQPRPPQ